MIQDVQLKWLIAIVVLSLPAAAAQAAINIDTVAVGNLANTADSTGYGAVSYDYNIGKYEVTAAQYAEFLNAVAATDTHGLYNSNMSSITQGCQIRQSGLSGSYSYSVASGWEERPVNFVSFWDAARFANWLHNGQGTGDTESGAYHDIGDQSLFGRNPGALYFLPTENEWYKAAYHKNDGDTGNYFVYPTSNDSMPSDDLVDPDPGNNATFTYVNYTIGSPYYRTEVGAHENSESPYGTFDQGGNVFEWNETVRDGLFRGSRGGSYTSNHLSLQASGHDHNYPFAELGIIGFRVASSAAVPEPGGVLVWFGLIVMGLIWWRRRR